MSHCVPVVVNLDKAMLVTYLPGLVNIQMPGKEQRPPLHHHEGRQGDNLDNIEVHQGHHQARQQESLHQHRIWDGTAGQVTGGNVPIRLHHRVHYEVLDSHLDTGELDLHIYGDQQQQGDELGADGVQVCKKEGVLAHHIVHPTQKEYLFRPDCSSELAQDMEAEFGQICLPENGLILDLDDVGTADGHQSLGLSEDHNPHLVDDGEDHCSHGTGQAVPLRQVHLKLNTKLINFPEAGSVGVHQGQGQRQRDAQFP